MRTCAPTTICESNLTRAWGRAFQHALSSPHNAGPMTISFGLSVNGGPEEDVTVRSAVDQALKTQKKVSVTENAGMLFPQRTWQRCKADGRDAFYAHYTTDVLPRIKALKSGKFYGTYFERMICWKNGFNQLEHIIEFWERCRQGKRRPRPSALITTCFDPERDHTFEPLRGFPCLQQVSFGYDRVGKGLAISAFYPCQYVFDRGYGNYLGLSHLGNFIADALQLRLVRVNCFVAVPLLGGVTKQSLSAVSRSVESALALSTVPTMAGTP